MGKHKWIVYTCDLTENIYVLMQIIEVKNQLVSTIALVDDGNKILIGKRPMGKFTKIYGNSLEAK